MRHHFRHPQAMFNKGSLFYSHCDTELEWVPKSLDQWTEAGRQSNKAKPALYVRTNAGKNWKLMIPPL
jgi:hypothetical protein